jgi:hypothetical protein
MSLAISTLLFAASATAQYTTSFWMPSRFNDEIGFEGSVVDVKDDKTTIAIVYDQDSNTDGFSLQGLEPETITLQGTTWFETVTTTSESFEEGDATYSIGCSIPSRTRAKPVCTYSVQGVLAYNQYCSDYSTYTDAYTTSYEYTYDGFDTTSVETIIETIDYRTYIPDFCLSGSLLPESIALNTGTMSRTDIETYQLVITAGQEKLGATAGSTPTGTSAKETSTGTQSVATRSDGSTPTAAASAPENTGAAPMITAAPILAGLGAMAALVL